MSCDPATWALDLALLATMGYTARRACGVDRFLAPPMWRALCSWLEKTQTYIDITVDMDELDLTSSEAKATYEEIKDYIFDKYRVKISSLYIAQVKQKHGIIERDCYNNSREPKSTSMPV